MPVIKSWGCRDRIRVLLVYSIVTGHKQKNLETSFFLKRFASVAPMPAKSHQANRSLIEYHCA